MAATHKKKTSNDINKKIKSTHTKLITSLAKLEAIAKKSGNKALIINLRREKEKIKSILLKQVDLRKSKSKPTKHISSVTGSSTLSLKKKEMSLLKKAQDIEKAYELISSKNNELLLQKQDIDKQTELLRLANQEILEKNQELETKAESILDQADYLHDANETIINMHQELAKQKDEIMHKNEELESLNAEKNNLIGIVAHDLKSPLNQIKGFVSLIKMTSKLEADATNCLDMIESSAIRLTTMIGKILDIEAIESKQLNLSMEPIDLTELFTSLAIRFKMDAIRKNITLIETISPGIQINIDRNYLTQIIENLLSNAIKFSPSNKNVFLNLSESPDDVVCEVRDEGPGLSDDDKKKLFSKYQKLSAKPTGSESSTGLGLSIVKKFTEAMGGQIWCESKLGDGASFFVKFQKPSSP